MNEKIVALLQDEKFVEELKKAESVADVQKLLAANGVEMSVEEIESLRKKAIEASENDELDDDQLEQVAGGKKQKNPYSLIYDVIKVITRW